MHFSREKLKEQAGWIILGLVVLVALGFLSFQEMNGRVIEAQRDATQWGDEAMVAREEASRANRELNLANEAVVVAREEASRANRELNLANEAVVSWKSEAEEAQSAAAHWESEAMDARREHGQAEARVTQLEARARSTATDSTSGGNRSSGGVGDIVRLARGASSVQVIGAIRSLLLLAGLPGWVLQAILGFLPGS